MLEDLSIMFADFGVNCVLGTSTALGLFDRGTQSALGGMALSEEESITLPATTFASLAAGSSLTVDAVAYTVREIEYLDDGKIKRATLRRV
jgi:hypothetical protein